jgi:hypothetical protein
MVLVFASMQEALHFCAQMPQEAHLFLSMRILKRENLFRKPRTVPTGQMELQYSRPFAYARTPIIMNVNDAIINEKTLNIVISSL